ncbi:MAG: hypothetical protein QOJ38_369 [Solirubrobacterales bacterium]|nr:hypothetical protein [Solirubrobacterales bacterium]
MSAALDELCERVLRENWVEGDRDGTAYSYTSPSPGRYPWQWYWDSCFAAIVWRRFDRGRARAELESLLSSADADGFIGHTVFWHRPVSLARLPYYNVRSRRALRTETIQPPLLAWAWSIAVGDPAAEPAIVAHCDWLERNRALSGDGLLWIVQPDESGLDASPKFDSIWGWRAHTRPGFPLLVHHNRRLGFDARRILAAGGPLVCEVVVNVLWCLSRLAMGRPSLTPALIDRLWDDERGLFLDEILPGGERSRVATWSALAPLALPDLPDEIADRLIAHLLDEHRFWTPLPPPSVAIDEPTYDPTGGRGLLRRYWRGPTWINAAWLLWLGLRRRGQDGQAAELTNRLEAAITREGVREYYDPRTGRGLGAKNFAWSTLILEMTDPGTSASGSYL